MRTFKLETSLKINTLLEGTSYYNKVGEFISDLETIIIEDINESNIFDFFNSEIYYLPFLIEALEDVHYNLYHELDIIRATLVKNKLNLPNSLKLSEMIKLVGFMEVDMEIDVLDYNFFN
jgi:hypothetical protein